MISSEYIRFQERLSVTDAYKSQYKEAISRLLLLISLVFLLSLVGCASKISMVKIDYLTENTPVPTISNSNVFSVHVVQFSDNRKESEPNVIGEAKTGIFNKSTPIVIDTRLDSLITGFFEEAFIQMGFKVLDTETDADLIFKGRINKFWLQEFATGFSKEHCEGTVELDVAIFADNVSEPIWFDVKNSTIITNKSMFDISAQDERIINETLNDAIRMVIEDAEFIVALKMYCASSEFQ